MADLYAVLCDKVFKLLELERRCIHTGPKFHAAVKATRDALEAVNEGDPLCANVDCGEPESLHQLQIVGEEGFMCPGQLEDIDTFEEAG